MSATRIGCQNYIVKIVDRLTDIAGAGGIRDAMNVLMWLIRLGSTGTGDARSLLWPSLVADGPAVRNDGQSRRFSKRSHLEWHQSGKRTVASPVLGPCGCQSN